MLENEKAELEETINIIKENKSEKSILLQKELTEHLDKLYEKIYDLPEPTNIISTFNDYIKNFEIWMKILANRAVFHAKNTKLKFDSGKLLKSKLKRLDFITINFEEALLHSSRASLNILELKQSVITANKNSIYGAYGEQKVVETLQSLSNEYILINNFEYSFEKALYNRKLNEYVKSVQIDHILVAPSGIFIIETKNWSKQSVDNRNLYSPAQQVKRANFILYILLKRFKAKSLFNFNQHWGNRKVPVRNIVAFINSKPEQEFDFVKLVTLSQLLPYIKYFTPIFTNNEVEDVADYLLKISEHRTVDSWLKVY
ncbi:hypothetical protein GR160_03855 [Flavobacterium sp. Sd200]|uniref:nuclease-related domain-containing protein n=1 Tax=Flavobacterium sp. Sd200 TaxID=2692211 RepID=UPI0013703C8A|nr:nuclease-related domain-containing protein [Flavobacterium sp. Sd200]MXN90350.1 hypothetical protein [Flavobacterium sp. Sd200]